MFVFAVVVNKCINATNYSSFIRSIKVKNHICSGICILDSSQKGFVSPGVFFSVGNGSKRLFEWLRLPTGIEPV